MRLIKQILPILLIVSGLISCAEDPETIKNTPECSILEIRDILRNSATVTGTFRGIPTSGTTISLLVSNDSTFEVSPTSYDNSMLVWRIDGLESDTEYTLAIRVLHKGMSLYSEPVSFRTADYFLFKDSGFMEYCLEHFDKDNDGHISTDESETVKVMDLGRVDFKSLEDIHCFPNLEILRIEDSGISGDLDLDGNRMLREVNLGGNLLKSVRLDGHELLEKLDLHDNPLESIKLSGTPGLSDLNLDHVTLDTRLFNEELSCLTNLTHLHCRNCGLERLSVRSCHEMALLDCAENRIKGLDLTGIEGNLKDLTCEPQTTGHISTIYINEGQVVEGLTTSRDDMRFSPETKISSRVIFADKVFENCCLREYDDDKDRYISGDEAAKIINLFTYGLNISSLKGLECFRNLVSLSINNASMAGTLVIGDLPALQMISLVENHLSEISFNNLPELKILSLQSNPLVSLQLKDTPSITDLFVQETSLGEDGLEQVFACSPMIRRIDFTGCGLESIDLSGLPNLESIECNSNDIKTLDLSCNAEIIKYLRGIDSQKSHSCIETIYLRPGQVIETIDPGLPPGTEIIVKEP